MLDTNHDLILNWRRDQRRRGLAAITINQRDRSLNLFARWLGRDLRSATREDIERFLDGRYGRGGGHLAPRARHGWLCALHSFYGWMVREEIEGAHDPTLRIQRPKIRPTLPRPIADRSLIVAIREADPRTRAILLTMHLAGARCMEIANLTREDILDTYQPPVVILRGKGDKHRVVPLHIDLQRALEALPMPRSGPVFRSRSGGTLTAHLASKEINRHLRDLGIDDTAHSLRHWFGTRAYQQSGDLRLVQDLLGHADPATTAIYTQWSAGKAAATVGALGLR